MMQMTKALITGITGMVGSHLADFLLEETDWVLYGMCRWRSPLDNVSHLLDRANRGDRLRFLSGDLRDYISLANVVEEARPDYVFHLAAQSYPTTSFTAPLDTLDTNILGTERLLEALRRCPGISPVVHVCASSEVYGRVSREMLPINEECGFHPASVCNLQGRDRSTRSLSCGGIWAEGNDDAHVHAYRSATWRCFR